MFPTDADAINICVLLPPGTILSVPIYDFANAHEGFVKGQGYGTILSMLQKEYLQRVHTLHSLYSSGDNTKGPFCISDRASKIDKEDDEEMMKRVQANDGVRCIYWLVFFTVEYKAFSRIM